MDNYLYHHGIKGQKWGVRRYQYADGTRTPAGRKKERLLTDAKSKPGIRDSIRSRVYNTKSDNPTDRYIRSKTELSRIQTSDKLENYAFYATYKKDDTDKYLGLFGKNLTRRAKASTGEDVDVYQLKVKSSRKLKMPSDENAGDILRQMMSKDKQFTENVQMSIKDSSIGMIRPAQQSLFNKANKAMERGLDKMTDKEFDSVYKAFNLSLTNHKDYEVSAQNKFYTELKKKGYQALPDYNDSQYSSYKAKDPVIVFDLNSVAVSSVSTPNYKLVNKLNRKYDAERLARESATQPKEYIKSKWDMTVTNTLSYMDKKIDNYLS